VSYYDVHLRPLLKNLGVEPLSDAFTGAYLFQLGRHRNLPVKTFLMTGQIVVGIGNIYANESLFKAGLSPIRHTCDLTLTDYEKLSESVKTVLMDADKTRRNHITGFCKRTRQSWVFPAKITCLWTGWAPLYTMRFKIRENTHFKSCNCILSKVSTIVIMIFKKKNKF
jgi:formamidopyrimidine-DNA glycosylase